MSGIQSVKRHNVFEGALDIREVDAFQKIFNEMSNLLMDITKRSNPRLLSKSDGFENWLIADDSIATDDTHTADTPDARTSHTGTADTTDNG